MATNDYTIRYLNSLAQWKNTYYKVSVLLSVFQYIHRSRNNGLFTRAS